MACSPSIISRRVYPNLSMRIARRCSADSGSADPQCASKLDTRRGGLSTKVLDRMRGGPLLRHEQLVVSPILKSKERVGTCPNWTDFFSEFGMDADSDLNIDLGLLSSIDDDAMDESDVDRLDAFLLLRLSYSSSVVVSDGSHPR